MASVVSHDFRGADVLERNSENDFQEQFLDDQGSQSDAYPPSQIYEPQLDAYTGNESTHQSHRVRGRSKKDLCKWFSIPVTECLLDEFYCAYRKKVLLQGRMFVFEHYICFNSSVFGYIKRRVIPLADLKHMRKKTYFHIPNTIEMEDVNGSKDFFTSFLSRDDAFNLIYKTWEKQRNHSLAENGQTSPDGHHRRTSNGSGGESYASSQDTRGKYSSLMNQDNLTEVESVSSSNAQELRSLGTSHPGDDDFNEKDLNDDPNSPKAPSMAAVDHLWIPQSTPAPTDGRGKHLVHARIPGTPRDFFDAVLRDGSTFLEKFLASQGNRQLVMSRWRPHEQLGFVRDLQFIAPIKGAFSNWGAAQTQCYQSHRFAVYDVDEHLVFESSQTMTDIPYGDCFTVDLRWDVTAVKGGEGAKGGGGGGSEVNFDVYIKVPFSRRCLFKSVIENGSHNQVQETYTGMVEQLRIQLADRSRMEELNGNGPSNSNSNSNNNNVSSADDASNGSHPPTPLSPSSSSKADGASVSTTNSSGNSNSNSNSQNNNNNNNKSSNNEKTVASRSGATDGKASVKVGGGGGGVASQKEEDVSTPTSRDGIPVVVRQGGSAIAVPPKRDPGSNDVSTEMKDEAPLLSPPHSSDAGPSAHPPNQNQISIISNVVSSNISNSSSSTHTAAIVARVCRLREKKATTKSSRGDDSTSTTNQSANTTGSGTSKLSPSSSPIISTPSSHSYSSTAATTSSSQVLVSSMPPPSLSSNSTTPVAAATAVLSSLSSGFNRLVHACADTLYGGIQNRSHMTRLSIRRGLPNALHGFRSKKKEKKLSHHRNHSQSQSQGAVKGEEGAGRKAFLRRRRGETGKDGEEGGEGGGYLDGREEEEGEGRGEGSSESGEGDFAEHENDAKESHHMTHHNHRTNDQKEHDSKSLARSNSKNSQGNTYTYPYSSNHSENSKDSASSSGSSATNGNGKGAVAPNQLHALIPGNANTAAAAAVVANNNNNHANLNNPQQCLPKRAKFLIATLLALILIQVLSCIVATHAPRGLWSSPWPSWNGNPDPRILPAPGFPYSHSNVYGRPTANGGEGAMRGGEGDLRGTGGASSLGNHPYAQTHILNHHPGEEKSHDRAGHPQPHFPSHKDGDEQKSQPNANANGDHLNRYRDELKMLHERIDVLTKLVEVSVSAQMQGIQSHAHVSGSEKYGSDESSRPEPSGEPQRTLKEM